MFRGACHVQHQVWGGAFFQFCNRLSGNRLREFLWRQTRASGGRNGALFSSNYFPKTPPRLIDECRADGPDTRPAVFWTMFSGAEPVPFLRTRPVCPRRLIAALRERCRTKIFTFSVGRRCCAALEFRAERQLCPATMVKVFVLRPARAGRAQFSAPSFLDRKPFLV